MWICCIKIYVETWLQDVCVLFFFFQAEDGIRDLVRSRGLGDVYKRQLPDGAWEGSEAEPGDGVPHAEAAEGGRAGGRAGPCLLYTSDAADERSSVDLGGRRIIKKKKKYEHGGRWHLLK